MHTVELIRDLKIGLSLNSHNLLKKNKDLTLKVAGQTSHRPSNTATPISVSVDEICLRQILSLLHNFVPCERSLYLFTNTTFSKRFRLPWNYQSCAVNNHLKECWLASKFESLSFLIQTKKARGQILAVSLLLPSMKLLLKIPVSFFNGLQIKRNLKLVTNCLP